MHASPQGFDNAGAGMSSTHIYVVLDNNEEKAFSFSRWNQTEEGVQAILMIVKLGQ